ncbi:MAG: hypothetical protein K4571_15905 [Deltaproteobacteria bacterium]
MNGNEIDDKEYWKQQEQQTQELIKFLPSKFKEYAAQQIKDYLKTLSPEDKVVWSNVIGKNPILRRVIYYVFSPPEETIIRFAMTYVRQGNEFEIRESFITDMEHIYSVLEQPDIRDYGNLQSFLKTMIDDLLRTLAADTFKLKGHGEDISELRSKVIVREAGKLTLSLPGSRMVITRNRMNVHVYEDNPDMASFFKVDDILIRQIQEYQMSELRNETFTDNFMVYVYNGDGELIDPPKGYNNPFKFSLLERYQGMIRKEGKLHNNFVLGGTIASNGIGGEKYKELESIFFEAVVETKSGHPSYIKKVFKGKVNDIYDQRSMVLKELVTEEIDGKLISTSKAKRRPFQEREDSIEDMLSENLEADDGTPALLSEVLQETPIDILVAEERETLRKFILELIQKDERLVRILSLKTPRSKKDQKYVERKSTEFKKELKILTNK